MPGPASDAAFGPALDDLAARVAAWRRAGTSLLVGLTGSVAAGKTMLAQALARRLRARHGLRAETLATDGFLLPNAVLAARGLEQRKGFPESYDRDALVATLAALRRGPAAVPGYSHASYDVDPGLARTVDAGDVLLVEGLGLAPRPDGLDRLLYIDAGEDDLESWYVARFVALWAAAEHDPKSFYARFRHLDAAGVDTLARQVWRAINLPNLRQHIVSVRDTADLVIAKTRHHRLALPA